MSFSDQIKKLKRDIARNAFHGSSWLVSRLSYDAMRKITGMFIAIGFRLTFRHRRVAKESIQIAFGKEKSPQETQKIIKECFQNFGKGMIELIYFMQHPQWIRKQVVFEGRENLDRALQSGRGVIAVSAHFGNFPLMLLKLAQEQYKINAIIRPARDQEIEKHFLRQRTQLGLHTIYSHPRKECVDNSIRALRNNEIVFIPLDQNFGSGGGVFVEFFGQKAATATGPVVFAMRTKALILPMFIVRQPDDTHKIIIDTPIELQDGTDDKDTIFINTARITQVIEKYIRHYPQEWGWMHRRWKSRPKIEEDPLV